MSQPRGRRLLLVALSGALATIALIRAPWWSLTPPLMNPPWVPVDLRFVLPTLGFLVSDVLSRRARWPVPATGLVLVAVGTAISAHLHASAALDFAGVSWAAPGVRVGVIGLAASLASILIALHLALETARERMEEELEDAGVPEEDLGPARAHASTLAETALATGAIAAAVLGLGLRIVDQFIGGRSLPLPEILGLAVVLAVGAAYLGWRGAVEVA